MGIYFVGTGEICIIALAVRCACDAFVQFACDGYFAKGL